jgi:hypothetical protein
MSQLAWGDGSGTSLQRGWWEWLAEPSRSGVAIMAESHAAPGISCSIEVGGIRDPANPFYFQHVFRWLRGYEQGHFSEEELNRYAFLYAANKSWVAPDISMDHRNLRFGNFARYAKSYSAAIADMRRSSVLPAEAGMLWRPYHSDDEGVLWCFTDQPLGVDATDSLSGESAARLQAFTVYRIRGSSVAELFGMRPTPEADQRLGREWTEPTYDWDRQNIAD